MRRVSVVGCSGSGKSTLGRSLAARLGVPYVELDAIHHRPGWTPIDPAEFVRRLGEITATSGWVVDGNYGAVVRDGPVWQRADTVVWLDLPRWLVMWQVTARTLRRVMRREELWNGNRERWSYLFSRDPERSIIAWAWTTHGSTRDRYGRLLAAEAAPPFDVVQLRSRADVRRWLGTLGQRGGARWGR